MKKTAKPFKIPTLVKDAERALQQAVKKVWEEHRLRGLPLYVWQNNRVVRIPARRIPTH